MKTAVAAPTQDPLETLRELLWARLRQLAEPDAHWARSHGLLQLSLAVWDEQRGWLLTRPGISHGPLPMMQHPDHLEEDLIYLVKTSLRAIQHRWDIGP
jgi:hypothetical protein